MNTKLEEADLNGNRNIGYSEMLDNGCLNIRVLNQSVTEYDERYKLMVVNIILSTNSK